MRAFLALQFALIATSNTLQVPFQLQDQQAASRTTAQRHWINWKVCNWLGINSQAHSSNDDGDDWRERAQAEQKIGLGQILGHSTGSSKHNDQANGSRIALEVPEYVLDYAPLVHLYSGEQFWPGDIGEHLEHVTPLLNYTPVKYFTQSMNLTNLDDLNLYNHGRFVYLTSEDNVEDRPDWLGGEKNIPDIPEEEDGFFIWVKKVIKRILPIGTVAPPMQGGRSDAPAVLIVVEKGEGVIDAFWFYFYSYNLGNLVFNVRFGNHVGDWEHCLVRFKDGEPKFVFVSEHTFGQAYSYDAIEKYGERVSIPLLHSFYLNLKLTFSSSQSFTPPKVRTPCTPPLADIHTCSPLVSYRTPLIAAPFGTQPSMHLHTLMTTRLISFEHPTSPLRRPSSGSTSTVTGEIKRTRWMILDNIRLSDSTIM